MYVISWKPRQRAEAYCAAVLRTEPRQCAAGKTAAASPLAHLSASRSTRRL